ncbi:YtxH domain-containing protein [Chryseolinea sp. T2]|uniref:YtxH domain-containing protein n=1 Tax=Chryseolinea sp. T2 TaxID=3129255 RepID=UPI0030771A8A
MNFTNKLIIAMAAAAAAGAIVGVLLAPEKGSETQKRIITKGRDWLSSLSDLLTQGKDILNATTDATKAP